ncbi:noggin-like [Heterodontus francisci]|uniref:noggin-like n=1 Tax=Heterodontus francisci TaxID=7792 RepID=UPI00355B0AEC
MKLNPPPRAGSKADSAWIRMKASNTVRPYSLSLTKEHYHYSPGPKHLNSKRLMKQLGSSYNPFWMSIKGRYGNESHERLMLLSRELAAGALRYQRKLWQAAQHLSLAPAGIKGNATEAARAAWRQWLVQVATCPLTSWWVDMGTVFWPRWVRHTDCDNSKASCSWPPGMTCTQAQWTHIKLLVWHCWIAKERVKTLQHCTWRQIPYPVVTACKCSCG